MTAVLLTQRTVPSLRRIRCSMGGQSSPALRRRPRASTTGRSSGSTIRSQRMRIRLQLLAGVAGHREAALPVTGLDGLPVLEPHGVDVVRDRRDDPALALLALAEGGVLGAQARRATLAARPDSASPSGVIALSEGAERALQLSAEDRRVALASGGRMIARGRAPTAASPCRRARLQAGVQPTELSRRRIASRMR